MFIPKHTKALRFKMSLGEGSDDSRPSIQSRLVLRDNVGPAGVSGKMNNKQLTVDVGQNTGWQELVLQIKKSTHHTYPALILVYTKND